MSEQKSNAGPLWAAVLFIVLIAAGAVLFLRGAEHEEPGEALLYDVSEFEKVDPALIRFEEVEGISPGIDRLQALAVSGDQVYVAGENTVAVYDLEGKRQLKFPVDGLPTAIAAGPDGEILVALKNRVQTLGPDGAPRSWWLGLGEEAYITSIAANDEEVYLADAGNRVVLRCSRGGDVLNRIGEKDADRDVPGFIIPSAHFDVAFDDAGALWAVNPGRLGLEQYRSNGELISTWYNPSMALEGFCGCCNPSHIAFRDDGSFVTAEKGLTRVKVYTPAMTFGSVVAAPESFVDPHAATMNSEDDTIIKDLMVDSLNRVLLIDGQQNKVRIFVEKHETGQD